MFLHTDLSNANYDEFMFTAVEINDTYHAEIHGQSQYYCWDDRCEFPAVKGF